LLHVTENILHVFDEADVCNYL